MNPEPGVRGDVGALKIDRNVLAKIWPHYLFLAFTIIEHLKDPRITKLFSLYQLLIPFSIFSCGIIQDYIWRYAGRGGPNLIT